MSNAGIKEILSDARRKKYAVPCFLAGNMEMIIGQVLAAEERHSPLIFAYNALVTPRIPMELAIQAMKKAAEKAKVPVVTILDHGYNYEDVLQAIELGFSSVMFDGSGCTYEENIRKTCEITKAAHAKGVSVEAELGSVGGSAVERRNASSEESVFTDPDVVAHFVSETGIDALAVSFGNVHGLYKGMPNLDIGRLQRIYNNVSVPLVMHGGSDLSERDYRVVIENGISKVNYYTVMGEGAVENIRILMEQTGGPITYHDLISRSIEYFYEASLPLLDLFGCSGQA